MSAEPALEGPLAHSFELLKIQCTSLLEQMDYHFLNNRQDDSGSSNRSHDSYVSYEDTVEHRKDDDSNLSDSPIIFARDRISYIA